MSMNNVIIGTAGHIDHGKTTLIKALSGIETDTTVEEKERGISINLGFAYFDLPSGKRCGVVDVPGHEKFIKNMLAGVSGINLVLLLVDAREGIMAQTKEHVDILTLLGIENYIIVMTKIDLVDEDYRQLVKEDIIDFIKDSPLENSPIIEVDSISKKGINTLLEEIDRQVKNVAEIKESQNARLNVDRAFQVKGFGTVITGTLTEGKVSIGDELSIYPQNFKTKVRNIQVHETDVKTAYAGQRTAINLANIRLEDVRRGCSLATPNTMVKTYMIDAEMRLVKDSPFNLKLWDRVRLYTGTTEVMARFVPLGSEGVNAGESGFAQLRLEEEIAVKNYDKFIIRTYSPMITIGGGVILDANPKKHKRFNEEILNKLKVQLKGNSKDLVSNYMLMSHNYVITAEDISKSLELDLENINKDLQLLIEENIILATEKGYIHNKKYEEIKDKVLNIVEEYHNKFRLKLGITRVELLSKFKIQQKEMIEIIELLIKNEIVKIEKNFISLISFKVQYDQKQLQEKKRIEKVLLDNKFSPPSLKEIVKSGKVAVEVMESLIGNTVVRVDEDIVFHVQAYAEAKFKIKKHFETEKQLTLAQFRDMISSSRKYAVALLDYFDRYGITKRVEDYRIAGKL